MDVISENGKKFELVFRESFPPFFVYPWESKNYHAKFEEIVGYCPDTITLIVNGELERHFEAGLFDFIKSRFAEPISAEWLKSHQRGFDDLMTKFEQKIRLINQDPQLTSVRTKPQFEELLELVETLVGYSNGFYFPSLFVEERFRQEMKGRLEPKDLQFFMVHAVEPVAPTRTQLCSQKIAQVADQARQILGNRAVELLEKAMESQKAFEELILQHSVLQESFENLQNGFFWNVSFSVQEPRRMRSFVPDVVFALKQKHEALKPKVPVLSAQEQNQLLFLQVGSYIKDEISGFLVPYSYYGLEKTWLWLAQKTGLSKETLFFVTPNELWGAYQTGSSLAKLAAERKQATVFRSTNKKWTSIQGKVAQEQIMRLKATIVHDKTLLEQTHVKGLVAYHGKIEGIVQKIRDKSEFADFQDGYVLVTVYTAPEFVPLMKKASAIVTDTGGMTSHAAIVSRELKKPCIVGTKVATKVFKTGDRVEVDADNGVVRKIG